jgi:CubicO group peptidase (beta-lactamase class C family)
MTRLSFVLAAACVALPAAVHAQRPSPIPEAELVRRMGAALDSLSAAGQFSGVVVLARQGEPVFQHAYGLADREGRRPNDVETAFNLGSINKVFTATAIRQLAEAGKLDLDSTLARYWPDYPNADVARRVTIRQLLQHRSGIGGNIFAAPAGGRRRDVRHNRDYLPLFVREPLQFEPGSRQQYSNAGYVVLGMLVERLSGEDYYEYVRRHVYAPAGMTRTAAWAVDSLPPNTAVGYTTRSEESDAVPVHPNTETLPGRGSGAGGGYSTAGDLLRFLRALREGKIPGGPPAGIGAAGGAPGINALVEGDLPGGYDLVVLANLDPPAAERVGRMVREWLGATDQ